MTARHVGICAKCGKRSYATRSEARSSASGNHAAEHLAAYRCGDYWHLGHLPSDVRHGRTARSQIRGRADRRAVEALAIALRAFRRDPSDGLAWLRAIAAREALARSVERHPAGKAAAR